MPDRSTDKPLFSLPAYAVFALIFTIIWLLHLPLLRLPYFWDEAGYYIPAARDLLLHGKVVPISTLSSGHPPLVMAWLAFWWKFSAYTPAVTRTAMLMVAAFGLTGLYRLAKQVSDTKVAVATIILTAMYPVWFAQSSLAQLDVAAAAFTFWGIDAYLREHRWSAIGLFALGGLAKETAIVAPLVLFGWEIVSATIAASLQRSSKQTVELLPFKNPGWRRSAALLISCLPLVAWFVYHHAKTGVFFGNPEFFRYNVSATAHPVRIVLALIQRFWQAFGYLDLFVLTILAGTAMLYAPLQSRIGKNKGIPYSAQIIFSLMILAYCVMLAVVGGAVIARYMLPVVPLVILICVSALRRRISWWGWACLATGLTFVLMLFVNPPYRISPEDNLTYANYIRLHKGAADILGTRYADRTILTSWPASDELTRPWLGYTGTPKKVLQIDNFSLPQLELASQEQEQYDVVYMFSTKLEPSHPMFGSQFWQNLQERFFDYHRDLPPEVAARMLGGRVVYEASNNGEWVAILEIDKVQNVRLTMPNGQRL